MAADSLAIIYVKKIYEAGFWFVFMKRQPKKPERMQKIYVLLRNDQQTGPYSLEEVIQFDLKPYDLIWIEGKSAGWYYPQEIGALRPYLSFLPKKPTVQNTTAPKTVFVSMPFVAKKEEPVTASLPVLPVETPKPVFSSFTPASKNLEEEVYAQFTPKAAAKETASTTAAAQTKPAKQKQKGTISVGVGITTVLVLGGVFAASWIMNRHSNEEETTPVETTTSAPAQEVAATTPATTNDPTNTVSVPASRQKHVKTSPSPKQTTTLVKQSLVLKQNEVVTDRHPAKATTVDETTTTAPVKEAPVATPEESTSAPTETTAPQEKKKKLRDKLFDIFRKKPEEQKTEEAQPSETTNGERRSTHRETGANLTQMVSIHFTVPNDWMMGIKGAKATLVNRSNQKIEKATVEVLYYNDDNELLQKKIITFSKIDGKESQTISIPDHASATRVDYNIVSVAGQPSA
jgi:hypothetical protein